MQVWHEVKFCLAGLSLNKQHYQRDIHVTVNINKTELYGLCTIHIVCQMMHFI